MERCSGVAFTDEAAAARRIAAHCSLGRRHSPWRSTSWSAFGYACRCSCLPITSNFAVIFLRIARGALTSTPFTRIRVSRELRA